MSTLVFNAKPGFMSSAAMMVGDKNFKFGPMSMVTIVFKAHVSNFAYIAELGLGGLRD